MAMKLCHLANPTKRFLCYNELETHRIVSNRAMTGANCFPNVVRLVKSWEQAAVPVAWFNIAKSSNLAKQYKDMPLKEYQELVYLHKLGKPDGTDGKSELAVVMEMVSYASLRNQDWLTCQRVLCGSGGGRGLKFTTQGRLRPLCRPTRAPCGPSRISAGETERPLTFAFSENTSFFKLPSACTS
jgi:hypothetical protein